MPVGSMAVIRAFCSGLPALFVATALCTSTVVPVVVPVPVASAVAVVEGFCPDALSELLPEARVVRSDFGVDALGDPLVFGTPAVAGALEPPPATCVFTFGPFAPCASAGGTIVTVANASAPSIAIG